MPQIKTDAKKSTKANPKSHKPVAKVHKIISKKSSKAMNKPSHKTVSKAPKTFKPREYWGKTGVTLPELDLTKVQRESYEEFLRDGIRVALDEINSEKGIEDFTGKNWSLKFGNYHFGKPKYTPSQAKKKAVSYDIPLRVEATLTNKKTGEEQTQEVFLGDIPKMTASGTSIINGFERAVVTQLVRSPGIFFSGDFDPSVGKMLYQGELRPLRGSWIEFNVGKRDVITVKVDRRRKMPVTVLLRAMGYSSDEDVTKLFADTEVKDGADYIANTLQKDVTKSQSEALIELYEKMRPGEPAVLDNAKQMLHQMFFDPRRYDLADVGRYKLNRRLKITTNEEKTVLSPEDIVAAVPYLVNLQNGN